MYKMESFPQIKDNFYLKARNVGASRKLKGDVGVVVCFMKKKPTDFSEATRAQFYNALGEGCRWLEAEAKRYGTSLTFKYYHAVIEVPEDVNPAKGYSLIRDHFNSQTLNMDGLQNYYEKKMNLDEILFLLVFDEVERSFAQKQSTAYSVDECSVLFKDGNNQYNWSTVAHELLHQFGAIDYYYPPRVTKCARFYFQNSIMGVGNNNVMDDFTAYLVGIKETISADTYHFLEDTMWMNKERYEQAIKDVWKDGSSE